MRSFCSCHDCGQVKADMMAGQPAASVPQSWSTHHEGRVWQTIRVDTFMNKVRWTILCGIAAVSAGAVLVPMTASAQIYSRHDLIYYRHGPAYSYGYGYGAPAYPPAYPPAYLAPMRRSPLPPREIISILMEEHRFKRVGQPRFGGHIYTVDGINRAGAIVRVYVDSFDGRIIDADVLQAAPRPQNQRFARLPGEVETPRLNVTPPRRPADVRPHAGTQNPPRPEPRTAARPPALQPDAPPAAAPRSTTPAVPLVREPRKVDPSQVRIPQEADRAPPMARGPARSSTGDARGPARPAPGASPVAPAPLDDTVRRPSLTPTPDVPVTPLF